MATAAGPQIIPRVAPKAPPGAGLGIEGAGAFEVVQQQRIKAEAPKQDAEFKQNVAKAEEDWGAKPVEKARGELFTAARDMYETWGMEGKKADIANLQAQVAKAKGTSQETALQQLDTATAEYADKKKTIDNLAAASEMNPPDKLSKPDADQQVMSLTTAYGFYQEQYNRVSKSNLPAEQKAKEMKDWEIKSRAVENSYYSMSELANVNHPAAAERAGNFLYNGLQEVLGKGVKYVDYNIIANAKGRAQLEKNPQARGFLEGKLRKEMAFRRGGNEASDPTGILAKADGLFERIRTGDLTAVAEARAETNRWLADDRLRIMQEANAVADHAEAAGSIPRGVNDTVPRAEAAVDQQHTEAEARARAAAEARERYVVEHGFNSLDQLRKAGAPLNGTEAEIIEHMAKVFRKDNPNATAKDLSNPDKEFIRAGIRTNERVELNRQVMEVNTFATQNGLKPDQQQKLIAEAAKPENRGKSLLQIVALIGIALSGATGSAETQVGAVGTA